MKRSYKYAHGSMLKFEQQASWEAGQSTTLTVGANAERYHAIPQGADLNAPITSQRVPGTILDTDIPDTFNTLRYGNVGVYGQAQYAMTPTASLTLGARADHNTRYGSTFTPRVGVVLDPRSTTTVKLLYGTAFLAPSPYQSYSHYGSFYSADGGATYQSDYWHVPNPDLEPQKRQTFEAEVRQSLGDGLTIWGSAFRSHLSNLIRHSDPHQAYSGTYLGWPVAYIDFPVNDGRSATYGATMGFDVLRSWAPDRRLTARASLSLIDGWIEDDDAVNVEPLGAIAPVTFRTGVDLDWDQWSVAPRLGIVGRQRVIALEETADGLVRRTLDGYTTLTIHLRRTAIFNQIGAFLTVENAFDARHRHINTRAYTNPEELVGAPQNPRRITAGLEIQVP
jgi:iron complex outermembrane receptor protein